MSVEAALGLMIGFATLVVKPIISPSACLRQQK
ncbi:putative holin-like toxin [Enterococcus sp. DIV1315a]